MLNMLIENLIIETLENKLNLDNEIEYIYNTLDKSHITDLQKLINNSKIGIQEFKLKAYSKLQDEDFRTELNDLGIEL